MRAAATPAPRGYDRKPARLLVLAMGAGCGLLCFSRLLHWLLQHFHQATMSLLTGFLFGCFNAFAITKLKIVPFVVTMGTLTAGRGIGLLITHSYSQDFPESVTSFSVYKLFGIIPLPIVLFAFVVLVAWLFDGRSPDDSDPEAK